MFNRLDILFFKINNIKVFRFIIVLNRNILIIEGNRVSVVYGCDIRFDEWWKLRNIKREVVILLSGVILERLMGNFKYFENL